MLGLQANGFALLTAAAVPICLVVAYYAWGRRPRPGAGLFAAFLAGVALWAVVDTVNLVLVHPATYELRTAVREGVAMLAIVAWFAFALAYTGRDELISRWSLVGLSVPAVVSVVVVAAGDPALTLGTGERGLWLGGCAARAVETGIVGTPENCTRGPWFYVHTAYGYTLTLLAIWLVVRMFASRGWAYSGQTAALVGGIFPPLLANAAWATGLGPIPSVDLTTPAFAVTGIVWGYALFHSDLLEVVPATSRLGERTAIDDLSDGVLILDDADRVVTMNAAAAATFGPSSREARGEPVDEVVGADLEVVPGERTLELATELGQRSLEVTVSPVTDAEDRRVGHTLVVRDVTERIQREQQLEALNRVLRHNLRNDMNVVRGYAATLSERVDEPEAEMADAIAEQSADLVEVGSKVRQMERIMEGEADTERFDLGELVRSVVDDVREELDGRVILQVPDDLWLDADRLITRTVLYNLVHNALEHNDADTPDVEVTARAQTDRWIEVTVSDDGPGIPEQEMTVLREGEETALRHGSGLGLWVVNWGVTALGGDLEFVTGDGDDDAGGTTVHVRLPGRVPPPETDARAGSRAGASEATDAD